MRKIKTITEYIDDELADSEKYVRCAIQAKSDGDTLMFQTAAKLSEDELSHAMAWHDTAIKEISEIKAELNRRNQEVPQYMLDAWAEDHQHYVEKAAEIRYMISML